MVDYTRQTAVPCRLAELRDGSFIRHPEKPPGIETERGILSRVNIIGTVVEKNPNGFVLDDGTAPLAVRMFDPEPREIAADVGDVVIVIGKPREYQGEKYIILEICKRLRNTGWIEYRRRELEAQRTPGHEKTVEPATQVEDTVEIDSETTNPYGDAIDTIRDLDSGDGASTDEVLDRMDGDGERILDTLIEEGEIFEIRPGRLKVLE